MSELCSVLIGPFVHGKRIEVPAVDSRVVNQVCQGLVGSRGGIAEDGDKRLVLPVGFLDLAEKVGKFKEAGVFADLNPEVLVGVLRQCFPESFRTRSRTALSRKGIQGAGEKSKPFIEHLSSFNTVQYILLSSRRSPCTLSVLQCFH